jgi:hypothetical protein
VKPWAQWLIGTGLVVVAWGVAAVTPPKEAREAPFAVHAVVGETATGRNIQATITSVQRTDRVSADEWSADGNWVVVHLTAEAVMKEPASLSLSTLTIGERTFSASERPDSFRSQPLAVGIPRSGSLAFELPADLDQGSATLTLGLRIDARLDSVIELPIDLGDLPHPPTLELHANEWTNG